MSNDTHRQLHLNGLSHLSDAGAASLGRYTGTLELNGLTSITTTAAEHLCKQQGALFLNGLRQLSDDAAAHLGSHRGPLSLAHVRSLSDAAVKHLSSVDGDLFLPRLRRLSDAGAASLSQHRGVLSLDGVRSLSDGAAIALCSHNGPVRFRHLKRVSRDAYLRLRHVATITLPPRPFSIGALSGHGLTFRGGNQARLASCSLPDLRTPNDLAEHLGITLSQLQWLCYDSGGASAHYVRFHIPKRKGGTREIASPKPLLKRVQKIIQETLLNMLEPYPEVATAYKAGTSIVDNALPHTGRAIVVRIDIQDFFPSITHRRVKGFFQTCGYSSGISLLLATLCTMPFPTAEPAAHDRAGQGIRRVVPQGAATSPSLANLICRPIDARVCALSKRLGFTYTRYADDLIFSHPSSQGKTTRLIGTVTRILADEGFVAHEEKTRVMRQHTKQVVTGLVVNHATPRLSRSDRRRFRAIAHHCREKGYAEVSRRLNRDARAYLAGYVAYANMVNPEQMLGLLRECPEDLRATLLATQSIRTAANLLEPPCGLTSEGGFLRNSIGMPLVELPPGSFYRQFGDLESIAHTREKLTHYEAIPIGERKPWEIEFVERIKATLAEYQHRFRVSLTQPFFLSAWPVTQGEYRRVMRGHHHWMGPGAFSDESMKPLTGVSWYAAADFCNQLSRLPSELQHGRTYRLPTEAEWQYACEGGRQGPRRSGDAFKPLHDYAWYRDNAALQSHDVAQKKPNRHGLHDMLGNVWEWCHDWYDEYPNRATTDPLGPAHEAFRVLRGGSFASPAEHCTPQKRNAAHPECSRDDTGFRVVMCLHTP